METLIQRYGEPNRVLIEWTWLWLEQNYPEKDKFDFIKTLLTDFGRRV